MMISALLGHSTAVAGGTDAALVVIDGDTLERNGHVMNLAGIDAPELGQWCLDGDALYACGSAAAFELKKLLTLEPVTCVPASVPQGTWDCRTPNRSLAELMVEEGLAIARDDPMLTVAEDSARGVPLGIWRGRFVDPARWREGERLPLESAGTESCPVLGVIDGGAKRYVVPTDADYDRWLHSEHSIEQRFCSDEAARASGYQHASARNAIGALDASRDDQSFSRTPA
jgi:endonuclease YncB( thermonuclease family)